MEECFIICSTPVLTPSCFKTYTGSFLANQKPLSSNFLPKGRHEPIMRNVHLCDHLLFNLKFHFFFVTENVGNAELEVVTPVIEELGKTSSIFAYFSLSLKSLKFCFIS